MTHKAINFKEKAATTIFIVIFICVFFTTVTRRIFMNRVVIDIHFALIFVFLGQSNFEMLKIKSGLSICEFKYDKSKNSYSHIRTVRTHARTYARA